MATPTVVEVDRNAPQSLSPIQDYTFGTSDMESRKDNESRRSRKYSVEVKDYNAMRAKYQEAKRKLDSMMEKSAKNRRMLLEMSGVINSLKTISVDYEHDDTASATPFINLQKKIHAIDEQLKASMLQCGNLEREKEAQEQQLRKFEEQIVVLQDQLKEALEEKRKQVEKHNNSEFDLQIEALKGSNEAKYLEIQAMEKKLQMLRSAQNGRELSGTTEPTSKQLTFTLHPSMLIGGGMRSKSSSSSRGSSSLESISEETSASSNDRSDWCHEESRDKFTSSRSFSTDESCASSKEHEGTLTINIATSYDDDSVEVMIVDKIDATTLSDVSYSTEQSTTASVNFDYPSEYNKAMSVVEELKRENEQLRRSHGQPISSLTQVSNVTSREEQTKIGYEMILKALDEERQAAALAREKYEKLQLSHAKMVADQKEERDKYCQLMEDYEKIAHRQADLESYEQLKRIHNALIMKVAEIGGHNEILEVERNDARKEKDQAFSQIQALSSELEATTTAYKKLQKENDDMSIRINILSEQCDSFKTKYYELLATDETVHSESSSLQKDERYQMLRRECEHVLEKLRLVEARTPAVEKLKRDYSEAQAKVAILEQSNKELESIRDLYHTTEAKMKTLERDRIKAEKVAKTAKKREEQRGLHLKDMLSHYKMLEKEHQEVSEKLKQLQAVLTEHKDDADPVQARALGSTPDFESTVARYERRIKELQQQRDAALEQMKQLEEEICQTRLEKVEATRARKEREQDLKVLLGHYHNLQKSYDELMLKTRQLENGLMADTTIHTAKTDDDKKNEEVQSSELFEPNATSEKALETKRDNLMISSIVNEDPKSTPVDTAVDAAEPENGVTETKENSGILQVPKLSSNVFDSKGFEARTETRRAVSVTKEAGEMEGRGKAEVWVQDPLHPFKWKRIKRSDMGTVSNVSEGVSIDNSEGSVACSHPAPSNEAPSTSCKDTENATMPNELEQAKSVVCDLEEKEKSALVQLEITEHKHLVATRDADDAKKL